MVQRILTNEGCFDETLKNQINDNFAELYGVGKIVPIILRQISTINKTNDTNPTILPGLQIDFISPATYQFQIELQTHCTLNGGISVVLSTNSNLTFSANVTTYTVNGSATTYVTGTGPNDITLVSELAADVRVSITGTMIVTQTGFVEILGAQNTASSDTTAFAAGSYFLLNNIRF